MELDCCTVFWMVLIAVTFLKEGKILNGVPESKLYYGEDEAPSDTYQMWRWSYALIIALEDVHSTLPEMTLELHSIHTIDEITMESNAHQSQNYGEDERVDIYSFFTGGSMSSDTVLRGRYSRSAYQQPYRLSIGRFAFRCKSLWFHCIKRGIRCLLTLYKVIIKGKRSNEGLLEQVTHCGADHPHYYITALQSKCILWRSYGEADSRLDPGFLAGFCLSANNEIRDGTWSATINEIHSMTCDPSTDRLYYADLDPDSRDYILRMPVGIVVESQRMFVLDDDGRRITSWSFQACSPTIPNLSINHTTSTLSWDVMGVCYGYKSSVCYQSNGSTCSVILYKPDYLSALPDDKSDDSR